jgi:hypothetical protein
MPMKTVLPLVLAAALTSLAHAQINNNDKKPAAKTPDLNASPWSVDSVTKNDGYFGSSSTTVKREMGDGWSVGGRMTTPYEDQKIGGSGAPGLKQYESPSKGTLFGPVLEKKF